jgi:dihydroflavonol-4-reductase
LHLFHPLTTISSGTRYVSTAAFAVETVEKVVVTSSEAAVAYNLPASKNRFTEDWTNAEGAGDYFRCKTLAERLAWELANDEMQNPRHVPLSTINPSMILGPSLVPWVRYSHETIKNIAEGKTSLTRPLYLIAMGR